jgi:putative tryptophan/tyrosine transport system substrate-binding protein
MHRKLVWLLTILFFTSGHLAAAEQPAKIYRIGLIQSSSSEATFIDAFRQSLRKLGYVEEKNFVLEIRSGDTSPDRLSKVAAELVRLKVDIIVAGGAPAIRAVKDATGTIPIVMRVGSDPIRAGFVPSLAHPVGNITGVASVNVELIGKRLELLLEIVPGIKRVAVLSAQRDPARFMATDQYKEMEAAARAVGVKLQMLWR